MIEFQGFEKISRLNREVVVTEKIDGTNGQVYIRPLSDEHSFETGYDTQVEVDGVSCAIRAGSRSRWLLQTGCDDNFGFGRWVHAHAHDLAALGAGSHFGEWWGQSIQRKYGLTEKRWSLFNTGRWVSQHSFLLPALQDKQLYAPLCCHVVPILAIGVGFDAVYSAIEELKANGSTVAPGFLKPEGVVAFHAHSHKLFKVTVEKDTEHKGSEKRD